MNKRFIILLVSVFLLPLSGCGNTMRQELSTQFQRLVVDNADEHKVRQVTRQVIMNYYGGCKDGKKKEFLVSKPLKNNNSGARRTSYEICTVAVLPYSDRVELFLQVSNKIIEDSKFGDYCSVQANPDQSELATPMERGESLPQFRQPQMRSIGRNTYKETQLLTQIKAGLQ